MKTFGTTDKYFWDATSQFNGNMLERCVQNIWVNVCVSGKVFSYGVVHIAYVGEDRQLNVVVIFSVYVCCFMSGGGGAAAMS